RGRPGRAPRRPARGSRPAPRRRGGGQRGGDADVSVPSKEEAAAGGLATRWVELVFALLIMLGGAIVVFDSLRLGAKWGSDGPQSGYFPFLVGVALLLASAWIAGSVLLRWRKLAGSVFVSWDALKPVLKM